MFGVLCVPVQFLLRFENSTLCRNLRYFTKSSIQPNFNVSSHLFLPRDKRRNFYSDKGGLKCSFKYCDCEFLTILSSMVDDKLFDRLIEFIACFYSWGTFICRSYGELPQIRVYLSRFPLKKNVLSLPNSETGYTFKIFHKETRRANDE